MDQRNSFFRPELADLPAYVAGAVAPGDSVIKASSNEICFPPLPGVQAAIMHQLGNVTRYPDMAGAPLRAAIAAYHQVSVEQIVVGNGSVALIEKFLTALATPEAEVVLPWPSFEAYPIAAKVAGVHAVRTKLRADGAVDLLAVRQAVTARTRALLLCTPNNPTSAALTHTELRAFLLDLPSDVAVLLDEAYVDFVDMPDAVRGVELCAEFPNVISLRTFAKAYGLAGLRVGYAICDPAVAQTLLAMNTPFGVNQLAQAAAIAALQARGEVDRRVQHTVAERNKLVAALRAQGWTGPDPQGNFVWFPGADTELLEALCRAEGLIVRALADGVRVTVTDSEGSLRLVRALSNYRAEQD
ncbi:MAG: histidinol-phosphate transaminase [Trueperella sp.]|nr:histidinol-phosphate transaminase [Trueperella sp.]